MLERWIGVSHRVGSVICYLILRDKGNVLYKTTVNQLNDEEYRDPDVQEQIRHYHGSLEDVIGIAESGTSLYGYESLLNDDEESIYEGDPNE